MRKFILTISLAFLLIVSFFSIYSFGGGFNESMGISNAFTDRGIYVASQPEAIYFNGVTYIAYMGTDSTPWILTYNHTTEVFSSAVHIATSPTGDEHFAPAIIIDENGYIHVFYGGHHSDDYSYHKKSVNPEDISSWGSATQLASPECTYPHAFACDIGGSEVLYVFYRHPIYGGVDFYNSSDGGVTWSSLYDVYDIGTHAPYIKGAISYDDGDGTDVIHITWNLYSGTHHDLYYCKSNDGGTTWLKADGTSAGSPPEGSGYGERVATGTCYSRGCALDENGKVYLLWNDGFNCKISDWGGSSWDTNTVFSSSVGDDILANPLESSNLTVYRENQTGNTVEQWYSIDGGSSWTYFDNFNSMPGERIDTVVNPHDGFVIVTGSGYSIFAGFNNSSSSSSSNISFMSINGQANNTQVVVGDRYFNWTRVDNASYYQLQISNSSSFSTTFVNLSDINESNYGVNYTELGDYVEFILPYTYNISWYGSHYYRVRAYSSG